MFFSVCVLMRAWVLLCLMFCAENVVIADLGSEDSGKIQQDTEGEETPKERTISQDRQSATVALCSYCKNPLK